MTVKERTAVSSNDRELLKNNFFIKKISSKFVLTSIVSMVFLYAGSLIDTLIVGLFLGEIGLSAMSLVSPVYLIYYTVGATIGIGACISSSRYLGKEDFLSYRKTYTNAIFIMAFMATIITTLLYTFINPLSAFLAGGKSTVEFEYVRSYLLFYAPAGAFNLIAYIPLYFLRNEGKPKVASRLFTLSAIINIVFSYIFMNPKMLNLGIGGASLATSISMLVVAFLGFLFIVLDKNSQLKLVSNSLSWKTIGEMIVSGIPNGLSNMLESARIFMINFLILAIGASAMLPCYTVVRNISDLIFSVAVGISSALIPIIGVFYGEKDFQTERSVIRLSKKIGFTIIPLLVLIVCLIPDLLFRLFNVSDPDVIREGRFAIPFACIGLIIAYINTLYTSYLTAIKREKLATILVSIRLLLGLAVFAIPLAFAFGTKGIWISFSLCEVLTYIIFFIIRKLEMKKDKNLDEYFLDTSYEKNAGIVFSVKNDVNDIVNAAEKVSEYCESLDVDTKRSIRAGNAIEEILTILIDYCLGEDKENYVDVRLLKVNDEVMLRFRYIGKKFDPISFYHENEDNEEMEEVLLGLKVITKTAALIDFRQTLGANTLIITF